VVPAQARAGERGGLPAARDRRRLPALGRAPQGHRRSPEGGERGRLAHRLPPATLARSLGQLRPVRRRMDLGAPAGAVGGGVAHDLRGRRDGAGRRASGGVAVRRRRGRRGRAVEHALPPRHDRAAARKVRCPGLPRLAAVAGALPQARARPSEMRRGRSRAVRRHRAPARSQAGVGAHRSAGLVVASRRRAPRRAAGHARTERSVVGDAPAGRIGGAAGRKGGAPRAQLRLRRGPSVGGADPLARSTPRIPAGAIPRPARAAAARSGSGRHAAGARGPAAGLSNRVPPRMDAAHAGCELPPARPGQR